MHNVHRSTRNEKGTSRGTETGVENTKRQEVIPKAGSREMSACLCLYKSMMSMYTGVVNLG
jgi:hypothetical protein